MLKSIKFIELYKYLFIGGVNAVFGYGVFVFFLFLDLHYSVAVLAATILGVMFNFQTYGRIVFKRHSWWLMGRFVFFYTALYFINIALLALFNLFLVDLYLAGAIAILFISYLGYIFK